MSDPQIDPVPGTAPPPQAAPIAASQARQANNPTLVIMIVMVMLAVVLAGAWLWRGGGRSGADQAATAFFRANADEGADAAYALTAPTFRDTTPASTWARLSQSYRLARMSDIAWTQHDAEGNVTTVRGTIHRAGMPDLPVAVDLRRIGSTWKVATVAFEAPAPLNADAAVADAPPAAAPMAQPPAAVDDAAQTSTVGDDTPGPVMSVPDRGPLNPVAPVQNSGRPGPAGSSVAAGQVGPTCMGQLWKAGVRTTNVDCPLYLPTRPGATEQCVARTQAGDSVGVTVTYLDYDALTRNSAIDCRAN